MKLGIWDTLDLLSCFNEGMDERRWKELRKKQSDSHLTCPLPWAQGFAGGNLDLFLALLEVLGKTWDLKQHVKRWRHRMLTKLEFFTGWVHFEKSCEFNILLPEQEQTHIKMSIHRIFISHQLGGIFPTAQKWGFSGIFSDRKVVRYGTALKYCPILFEQQQLYSCKTETKRTKKYYTDQGYYRINII